MQLIQICKLYMWALLICYKFVFEKAHKIVCLGGSMLQKTLIFTTQNEWKKSL